MFPSSLAAEDLALLSVVSETSPGLQEGLTYSVTVDERRVYSWCFQGRPTDWGINLEDDDLVPFLPNGSFWRAFGSQRSWALIPVYLPQASVVLFGIERIIIEEPRPYPIAFYWVLPEAGANTVICNIIDVLLQQLKGATGEPIRKSEESILHQLLIHLRSAPTRPTYARTQECDALREKRIVDHFLTSAANDLTELLTVGPDSRDSRVYSRGRENPISSGPHAPDLSETESSAPSPPCSFEAEDPNRRSSLSSLLLWVFRFVRFGVKLFMPRVATGKSVRP